MQVKAFMFDLGWTLFDEDSRLTNWSIWLRKELHSRGYRWKSSKIRACYKEMCLRPKSERLTSSRSFDVIAHLSSKQIAEELMTNTPWHSFDMEPYPSAIDCLKFLSNRNVKLGIVSNQGLETRKLLERWCVFNCFAYVGISKEVGLEKPNLDFFKLGLEKLHVKAEECVYVGDRIDHDIVPSNQLGMYSVRILTGPYANVRPTKLEENPTLQYDSMQDFYFDLLEGKHDLWKTFHQSL